MPVILETVKGDFRTFFDLKQSEKGNHLSAHYRKPEEQGTLKPNLSATGS